MSSCIIRRIYVLYDESFVVWKDQCSIIFETFRNIKNDIVIKKKKREKSVLTFDNIRKLDFNIKLLESVLIQNIKKIDFF